MQEHNLRAHHQLGTRCHIPCPVCGSAGRAWHIYHGGPRLSARFGHTQVSRARTLVCVRGCEAAWLPSSRRTLTQRDIGWHLWHSVPDTQAMLPAPPRHNRRARGIPDNPLCGSCNMHLVRRPHTNHLVSESPLRQWHHRPGDGRSPCQSSNCHTTKTEPPGGCQLRTPHSGNSVAGRAPPTKRWQGAGWSVMCKPASRQPVIHRHMRDAARHTTVVAVSWCQLCDCRCHPSTRMPGTCRCMRRAAANHGAHLPCAQLITSCCACR